MPINVFLSGSCISCLVHLQLFYDFLSFAENAEALNAIVLKTKRLKPPNRLSLSPMVEPKDTYSFPDDEKAARKEARVTKVPLLSSTNHVFSSYVLCFS